MRGRIKLYHAVYFLLLMVDSVLSRIHKLEIQKDGRKFIQLSTFGFYKDGLLNVNLMNFHVDPEMKYADTYGFSIDKTFEDEAADLELRERFWKHCPLNSGEEASFRHLPDLLITLDFEHRRLRVNCSSEYKYLHVYDNFLSIPTLEAIMDQTMLLDRRKRDLMNTTYDKELLESEEMDVSPTEQAWCADPDIPIAYDPEQNSYNASFIILFTSEINQGMYSLYFHSCPNYVSGASSIMDFTVEIEESNGGNYLSAGDMPLPTVYTVVSIAFFLSGCVWTFVVLRNKRNHVHKFHHLMAAVFYLQSLSALFSSMNYQFIQIRGERMASWAILHYISDVISDSMLVIMVFFINTGWLFKKPLSAKDKIIFPILISLQIVTNGMKITMSESDGGDLDFKFWQSMYTSLDILCWVILLFPFVACLKYLRQVAVADVKRSTIHLRNLELFKRFYGLTVTYIYFSRIIIYLMQMVLSFEYNCWLGVMVNGLVTYVFCVLTAYLFYPVPTN